MGTGIQSGVSSLLVHLEFWLVAAHCGSRSGRCSLSRSTSSCELTHAELLFCLAMVVISVNGSLTKGEYISSGSHIGKEDSQVFIDYSIGSTVVFMRE